MLSSIVYIVCFDFCLDFITTIIIIIIITILLLFIFIVQINDYYIIIGIINFGYNLAFLFFIFVFHVFGLVWFGLGIHRV